MNWKFYTNTLLSENQQKLLSNYIPGQLPASFTVDEFDFTVCESRGSVYVVVYNNDTGIDCEKTFQLFEKHINEQKKKNY